MCVRETETEVSAQVHRPPLCLPMPPPPSRKISLSKNMREVCQGQERSQVNSVHQGSVLRQGEPCNLQPPVLPSLSVLSPSCAFVRSPRLLALFADNSLAIHLLWCTRHAVFSFSLGSVFLMF